MDAFQWILEKVSAQVEMRVCVVSVCVSVYARLLFALGWSRSPPACLEFSHPFADSAHSTEMWKDQGAKYIYEKYIEVQYFFANSTSVCVLRFLFLC